MRPRRAAAFLLVFLALSPFSFAEGLPDLGEAAQADLPPAMERRIGVSLLNQYRQENNYIDDPEILAYINRIGHRLSAKSDDVRQEFEFFVLRDPTLNAFAMPGGMIGVHSGLIQAAQSESELAGVLAHEISHVTQRHLARIFGKQSQAQMPMLLAMAVALLAARNNSNVGMGGLVAAQAATIQSQLNYSRDFEREADRLGLRLLEKADFDIRGMEAFFERLQKFSRLYESNAPGYLRTHPLTTERIADMSNRIQGRPYKQVRDSLEFLLVKAKLTAQDGASRDAVTEFAAQIKEHKYSSEIAARFGLAYAQLRALNVPAANQQLNELRRLKAQSSMVETLAALIQQKQGDLAGAEKTLRQAMQRYPQDRPVTYALAEILLASKQYDAALDLLKNDVQLYPSDARLYTLMARTYSALGKRLDQHRAQAESYAQYGQLHQAIEQMELAQKSPDGDFYEYSQVEARLRELKEKLAEENKLDK